MTLLWDGIHLWQRRCSTRLMTISGEISSASDAS